MRTDLTRLDLRLRRRGSWAYSLGVAAYALLIVVLYPAFKHDSSLDQLMRGNPTVAALFGISGSLVSPAGWLNANLYANVVPLFALLLTIGYGATAVAGENSDERLGLFAALPVSRHALLAQKVLTLAVLSLPVAIATLAADVVGRFYQLRPPWAGLVGATVGVALTAMVFGCLALAVGCLTNSRGVAIGVASTVAAASYVISSLAGSVAWVHHLRLLSPLYWSVGQNQVERGLPLPALVALVATTAVLGAVAFWGFDRLDLR
jgi:ABC-2 type transport system permease protein